MQRDTLLELIRRSMLDGAETIVLVMPRQGNPIVATSKYMESAELTERVRGWAGFLENCIQNRILLPADIPSLPVQ